MFHAKMCFRFHNSETLLREVTRLVRNNPTAVNHIPTAIQFLVTPHSVEVDAPEVSTGLDKHNFWLLFSSPEPKAHW